MLLCAVLMSILLGNGQMVKAEANLGEKLVVEEPIEFVDNEGNVMAIFIPYSPDSRKRDDEFSPHLAEPPEFY